MYQKFFKPFLDFTGALILLVLLFPVILITSILIRTKLGSPILFRQARPGKNKKIFYIFKFRTMSNKRDQNGELLCDEQRLGALGKTLRALSIDELPQLFNVLKGEISFIGPRPLLIEYLPLYNGEQKIRHDVKPGISGWAQVNGRNAITWKKKFELDSYYVKNQSFLLDIKIILLTIKKVLKRSDVSASDHVTVEKFNGHN